jgi:hypothetical protein
MSDIEMLERRGDIREDCAEDKGGGDIGDRDGVEKAGDFLEEDEEKMALNRLGEVTGLGEGRGRSNEVVPVAGVSSRCNGRGGFDGEWDGGNGLLASFSGDDKGNKGALDWESNSDMRSPT